MEDEAEAKDAITRKVIIHRADIPLAMQNAAVAAADVAMDKHGIEKDVATELKKIFDMTYGGTWHCVVGTNYGSSITHRAKYIFFFQLDQARVLIFCSDAPANTTQVMHL